MSFSAISFTAAGLVSLAALAWLALGRVRAEPLRCAWLALAANAIWAFTLIPEHDRPEWWLLPMIELLRYAGWLLTLHALLDPVARGSLRRINATLWCLSAGLAFFSPVIAVLLLACAGLVSTEHLLRNARPEQRRGIKLSVIALGGVFAWDLFFYSEYALMGAPNREVWGMRGLIYAALLPVFLLGLSRTRGTPPPPLFVSRQAVFYSTAFLAVGVYLIAVALAAQYLRTQSAGVAQLMRPLLLAGAGVVLAVLLASESPRRHLRVFLAKHFYRNKYDYRVEWLRFVGTLARQIDGDARATSIRAIAQIFESPGGALFLCDDGSGMYVLAGTWFAEAQSREDMPALAPEHDLIRFMVQKDWVVDLDEYRRSPSVYQSIQLPMFLRRPGAPWRIVSPLFQQDRLQGFIVLLRPPEPFTMTYEDRDLLRMVGRHVATLLAQQSADRRLAESRQFDAFNRFSAFVMHDLKNSVAQLQLLTSNAGRHRHNPEFIDDAFITIENAAARITRLMAQLQSRDARTGQSQVQVGDVIRAAVGRCCAHQPRPLMEIASGDWYVTADAERLTAVFEHVLRNAQEAAGATGEVRVGMGVEKSGHRVAITIADTGPGMDPEFVRDRLFRPFDSTKGASGMGIGAYQARAYILELGGTMEVRSAPGSGTRFIIRIPLCQNDHYTAS